MIFSARHDKLLSQHIDVAVVYKDMLGLDEARTYLEREKVPKEIIERILFTEQRRQPPPAAAPRTVPAAPLARCRRKNHIHDAIVEAALKIERKLGSALALTLLKDEQVPETVAERILAQGPRQLRARSPAQRDA